MNLRFQICLLALACFWSMSALADPGDTAKAVVVYGSDQLFDDDHRPDPAYLESIIDSLESLPEPPQDYLNEIKFYSAAQRMNQDELNQMIDSLFQLEEVPYALINELNMHIAYRPEDYQFTITESIMPIDDSPYPANYFYEDHWNERYPFDYPNTLANGDTSIMLVLTDPKLNCEYFHPVGTKPEYKYYGYITSHFGWRRGRSHNGTDLAVHQWDEIHAAFGGKVRYARYHSGYGKCVVIRHHNGLETLYAHMNVLKVKAGQEVDPGTVLGLAGDTGESRGTHLHFEIRFKGVPVNPTHVIDFSGRRVYADTVVLKQYRHSYSVIPVGNDYHVVKRGDYLHKIAKRYGVNVETLCKWNGMTRNTRLTVGDKIRIRE